MKTRVTELFSINVPIIQAGMVWVSGWKLASAVSNVGALGMIGAGSMKPELLREHLQKTFSATKLPFGVNVPLLRGDIDDLIAVILQEHVEIVFTSAGHPGRHIEKFKRAGCKVVHVVANVKQALKAEETGCDAIVAEGFEAGGHNGIDEITTLALIPQVVDAVKIPVIAAGGIADGRGMLAAFALGAEAVQVGTRFAATVESSAHDVYKQKIVEADDGDTVLTYHHILPVRAVRNPFMEQVQKEETQKGMTRERMMELHAKGRERKGIFEGNWEEGEMEMGQSSGLVHDIISAAEVVKRMMNEFESTKAKIFDHTK
ncbi:MAG: nitronate monooxygenase [Bacteriovoracaceae bacterium]|nr:nitronate monooxygenase [Bacteroidota bacterium]